MSTFPRSSVSALKFGSRYLVAEVVKNLIRVQNSRGLCFALVYLHWPDGGDDGEIGVSVLQA